jgi:hypothetical protein
VPRPGFRSLAGSSGPSIRVRMRLLGQGSETDGPETLRGLRVL